MTEETSAANTYKKEILAIAKFISLKDFRLLDLREEHQKFEEDRLNRRTQSTVNYDYGWVFCHVSCDYVETEELDPHARKLLPNVSFN